MKKQNGITLIALVITIIVMLILVGVSVTVALNGGLFRTAEEAVDETALKRDEEMTLSEGRVQINGEWYDSMADYANGSGNGGQQGENQGNIAKLRFDEMITGESSATVGMTFEQWYNSLSNDDPLKAQITFYEDGRMILTGEYGYWNNFYVAR